MKLTVINKSKLNLSIDILMFLLLVVMAGIGFLMKYVVVSGEVRNEIYGNHTDLEFFGLTRHQWGSIHLIISIIFLAMLVLHIIFHWKLIVGIYRSMFSSRILKYGIAGFLILFGLIILIAPFLLKPELVPFEPKYRNKAYFVPAEKELNTQDKELLTIEVPEPVKAGSPANIQKKSTIQADPEHHDPEYDEYEVYGYHTLQFIAEKYNVPASVISRDLNIPENLSGERLSVLRKHYGFTMTDVRKSIATYKKNK
jgi:hypothetical protein